MSIPRIIERLIDIVGPDGVFHQPSDLIVYEYDGSVDGAVDTARPVAVVLPRTAEQVSGVVKLARQEGIPVTPRGAGTGLSGGAVAQAGGIVVALTRMDKVLEIDPIDRTALVEPGVINLELSEFTAGQGLFFAPIPPASGRDDRRQCRRELRRTALPEIWRYHQPCTWT